MKRCLVFLTGIMLAIASMCNAGAISWNTDNYSTVGGDGSGSHPELSSQAGAYLTGGWINDWPDYDYTDLRDNSGIETTMDIAITNNSGGWIVWDWAHPGQDSNGSWNNEMLNGYLNGGGEENSVSITLSEIPYAAFDVYVYVVSDDATRTGTVTDGTTTYSFGVLDSMINPEGDALLVQTTNISGSNPEANFAVFSGLTESSYTFSTSFYDSTGAFSYGGIAGFQVVEVPEPTSLIILGVGALFIHRKH